MSVPIGGEPITHTCLPKSTSIELSSWELELLTKLAISLLHLDGSYVKTITTSFQPKSLIHLSYFIKDALKCREFELSVCVPYPMGLQSLFG